MPRANFKGNFILFVWQSSNKFDYLSIFSNLFIYTHGRSEVKYETGKYSATARVISGQLQEVRADTKGRETTVNKHRKSGSQHQTPESPEKEASLSLPPLKTSPWNIPHP